MEYFFFQWGAISGALHSLSHEMHFSKCEPNDSGTVWNKNHKQIKTRIKAILQLKGSILEVQVDDLKFFDFNNLKPSWIHPSKIRRSGAHYGQLHVELTFIDTKVLDSTPVQRCSRIYQERY